MLLLHMYIDSSLSGPFENQGFDAPRNEKTQFLLLGVHVLSSPFILDLCGAAKRSVV